jgi:hypothetical protein
MSSQIQVTIASVRAHGVSNLLVYCWRRADLRPDYSLQQAKRMSAGWMMPP